MKRFGNLYDRIISMDNLVLADKKARRGKKKNYGVKLFDEHREENLNLLRSILLNNAYHTSEYHTFTIYEPKERLIYRLPYFPDRIVHHAIMNVMESIWVKTMTDDTYSCIKKRGIHKCMYKIKRDLYHNRGKRLYCLKLDVRKFYPSIDPDELKKVIRRKIKDYRLLKLLDEIIDSTDGVPIGNYLSQFFANIFLSELDHSIKENFHMKYYYRYADDIVIISENKNMLFLLLDYIKKSLKLLKLEVKKNWQVFPISSNKYDRHGRGIDFLGYVFYMNCIYLRKRIKYNFMKKALKLHNKQVTCDDFIKLKAAWYGWCKHANTRHLYNKIIKISNNGKSIKQQYSFYNRKCG